MDLTLQKLALILSPAGPIMGKAWQVGPSSLAKQASHINTSLEATGASARVTKTIVGHWVKGEVRRADRNVGLETLCLLVRASLRVNITPDDIINQNISVDLFAEKMGFDKFIASRLIASFALNSIHWPSAFDFFGDQTHLRGRDPAYGVFKLNRYHQKRRKAITSTCLLIIDEDVVWYEASRAAPFAALFVPTGKVNAPFAYYTGLLSRCDDTIYMTLKNAPHPGHLNDMCQIILEPADGARYSRLIGVYASANIEGQHSPSTRYIEAIRLSSAISQIAVEEALQECSIVFEDLNLTDETAE